MTDETEPGPVASPPPPRALLYHGRPMDARTTRGKTPADVACLLAQGAPVIVDLEPGDATRYRLVLTLIRENGTLLVSRDPFHAGPWFTVTLGLDERVQCPEIANGNWWSGELLAWWVQQVVDAVSSMSPESEAEE